jgi:hypothetical protein
MSSIGDTPTEGGGDPRAGRVLGDDAARFVLGALSGPYLPWGPGAMRPAGLVEVCNDIVLNDRRRVVELGSGISTVLLARLFGQLSGAGERRLVAVEHDARWGRWVVDQLAREGVGDHVVVVDAPLCARSTGEAGPAWYDEAAVRAGLDAAMGGELVDLLVVDGPPAFAVGLGLARHPALSVLWDRLASGGTVVLDDVERPGEKEVLRRWESEFGLVFRREERNAGVAIATIP